MTRPGLLPEEKQRLLQAAQRIRESILHVVFHAGSGHVGAALSQADILTALYLRYLRIDPLNPHAQERDRFVLSKGHGGLGLASVLAERGFFPEDELAEFGQTGAAFGMHLDHRRVPGIDASTGSPGHGLGLAVGMALGERLQGRDTRVFCLLSDGECYEGSTWEAAMCAPNHKLSNLVAIVDRNFLTMDGYTEAEQPLEPLAAKWSAFGWNVKVCVGHDMDALCAVLDEAVERAQIANRPTVVLAETVKGKGVSFMENEPRWHYGALDSFMFSKALSSVRASAAQDLEVA